MFINQRRIFLCGATVAAAFAITMSWNSRAIGAFLDESDGEAISPSRAVLLTATQSIRAIAVAPDGAIWAASEGGVLRWPSIDSSPQIWTTANGLDSNDFRSISIERIGAVTATTINGEFEITLQSRAVPRKRNHPADSVSPDRITAAAQTRNGSLTATASGLFWSRSGDGPKRIDLPRSSPASHVSALVSLSDGSDTYAAGLYGDGVYRLTLSPRHPARWERLPLPDACRRATTLASLPAGQLLIGTRHDGVFVAAADGRFAAQLVNPNAMPSGDIYGIATYKSLSSPTAHVFASTFDQGVLEIEGNLLTHVYPAVAQGRALVPFDDKLYVLGADHSVQMFDGSNWKSAWSAGTLRRAEIYSIAVDPFRHRLLVGGWGGWAEWDGSVWQQHWAIPSLNSESITAIAADETGAVWVGTQRHGLIRFQDGVTTPFQEAQGLTDDWITELAVSPGGRLLVGTYTGGLLERVGGRFVRRLKVDSWAIRAIAFDGETAFAATPVGMYRERLGGDWRQLDPRGTAGAEAQAILPTPGGIWVGTRCGLAFLPDEPGSNNIVRDE